MKGCPYDNAVAESTFKMIKAEFVAGRRFDSIEQLRLELADYVHWFNHIRWYSHLGTALQSSSEMHAPYKFCPTN